MSGLNDATIRYCNAGLCDESRRYSLAATLRRDETSIAALDQAIATGVPLTLSQYDAIVDPEIRISDRIRYGIAFGRLDERINDFAMSAEELAEVTARARERGTPMTEDEIVYLSRNVDADVMY